jgi:hypothetical protein
MQTPSTNTSKVCSNPELLDSADQNHVAQKKTILVGGNKLSDLGGASSVSSVSWVAEATPSTTTLRRLTLLAAACAAGALVDGPQGRHCIRGGGGFVPVCGARAAIFGSLGNGDRSWRAAFGTSVLLPPPLHGPTACTCS